MFLYVHRFNEQHVPVYSTELQPNQSRSNLEDETHLLYIKNKVKHGSRIPLSQ